jgi:nucleoside-diphosphate-sugar epimerase
MELLPQRFAAVMNLDLTPPLMAAQNQYWKQADIMDPAGLVEAFRAFAPSHVIHLAARCDCDENTTVEKGYRVNTEGTANVLAAIKAVPDIQRAVITSTQFVFDKKDQLPEGDLDYAPKTVYGRSKVVTERLTREAGLPCTWTLIRPTNVWGPWHLRHTRQFFKILKWGLYVHPGREPVMRSYAYVGNVVEQIVRILEADPQRVHGKTLYVGDPPLNVLDWVNGFSWALKGKGVKIIPRGGLRAVAKAGDLVSKVIGRDFFITSSRFRSMTDPYLTPMDDTFEVLGPNTYGLQDGIDQTVVWLKSHEGSGFAKPFAE